jgi:hypothetical protein
MKHKAQNFLPLNSVESQSGRDHKLSQILTKILVEGFSELVERRWNLQTLIQNAALPLNANILRPFHEPVEVSLGGEGSTDTKLLRPLLE